MGGCRKYITDSASKDFKRRIVRNWFWGFITSSYLRWNLWSICDTVTLWICGMNLAERRAIFSRKWETVLVVREVPRAGSLRAEHLAQWDRKGSRSHMWQVSLLRLSCREEPLDDDFIVPNTLPGLAPGCRTGNGGKISNTWFDGLNWFCLGAA